MDALPLASKEEIVDNPEAKFLLQLQETILAHLLDVNFSVPELSKIMQMSHVQIYRKLKALSGKTPVQFIRFIRLKKAMDLLQNSDLNITEIAYETGFSDPNYFTRTFTKEFGMPPSAMRV